MNTCLFRSVLVRISFVPYKYIPIYMYICYGYVLDRYPYTCTIIKIILRVDSKDFD